jgi:hypothetical protein
MSVKLKKSNYPFENYINSLKIKGSESYKLNSDLVNLYPTTNLNTPDTSVPLVLISDLRVFGGRLNSDGGTTTLYTVPDGYFFYINQIFKLIDSGGPGANPLYLNIYDKSANLIFRLIQNWVSYDGLNKIPEVIKLIAGDYITIRDDYFSYHGYSLSVSIIGTLELDTSQIKIK